MTIDPKLRPEGWAPRYGSSVVLLPETNPAADAAEPPPGRWTVLDRAPEATQWWIWPADGEAKAWAVASMGGRRRDQWPTGWPGQTWPARRMFPAHLVQRSLPC